MKARLEPLPTFPPELAPYTTGEGAGVAEAAGDIPTVGMPTPPDLTYVNPALAAAFQQIIDETSAGPNTPGITMLVNIPGQGRWIGASGLSDRVAQTPMQPGDRFRIASVTKMFIATMVLQLVEENILLLDHNVEQWLPGMVPNGHNITIRQLLSHTSGLYDYLDGGFENMYFAEDPPRVWQSHELVQWGVSHRPYFGPGEPGRWKYSNTNYILLGMIIEQSTHMPLVHELNHRIFEPLNLQNTFLEDYEEIPGGFVRGYIGDADYTYASLSTWAAGGIVSNAEDVGTFVQALFEGKLLGPEMLSEMQTFEDMAGYPVYGLGVTRNIEGLAIATQGVMPTDMQYQELRGHIGGLSGFKSVACYMPETGITIVVLINQMYTPVVPVAIKGLNVATGKPAVPLPPTP